MPELPEVETVVRSLKSIFKENSVKKISYLRKDLRFPIPQKKINKILIISLFLANFITIIL